MSEELKPCPFCGASASIERIGDRRQSTIYACDDCGCRLETGEEWGHGRAWNRRDAQAQIDALKAALEDREKLAELIYLALYGHYGAIWAANEDKDVWRAAADRLAQALPTASSETKQGVEAQ